MHPSQRNFQALIQGRSEPTLLEYLLVEVQAIILYLLTFLFGKSNDARASAISYLENLNQRVMQLERQACDFTVRNLTPWQAWLLAESTRRTILSSHILTCVFLSHKYDSPEAKIHMEALPFDDRGGLWLAKTPQAWVAAAGVRRGAEVKPNLVSWHEFGCKKPSICMDEDGDQFLSMMLVCHNGKASFQQADAAT